MIIPTEHSKFYLPLGEGLRALLNSSSISESSLNQILRNRGVFLQSASTITPMDCLITSIISPKEFDFLREKQNYKEDKGKRRTKILNINPDIPLIDLLPELDATELPLKEFCNYELTSPLNYAFDSKDKNKASIEIPIEIIDSSKNWATSKSIYPALITFEKQNDKLIIKTTSTAKETTEVSEIIITEIKKDLKKRGHVDPKEEFQKILFSSFDSNKDRIRFFLRLIKTGEVRNIDFKDVNKIGIIPTTDKELPEKIEWMATTKNLMLDGDELHKIFFVTDEKYSPHLIFYKLTANYKFTNHFSSGVAEVVFEFPQYYSKRESSIEFEIKINKINLDEEYKNINKSNVESWLLDKMTILKLSKFKVSEKILEPV